MQATTTTNLQIQQALFVVFQLPISAIEALFNTKIKLRQLKGYDNKNTSFNQLSYPKQLKVVNLAFSKIEDTKNPAKWDLQCAQQMNFIKANAGFFSSKVA